MKLSAMYLIDLKGAHSRVVQDGRFWLVNELPI